MYRLRNSICERLRKDFGGKFSATVLEEALGYTMADLLDSLDPDHTVTAAYLSGEYHLDHVIPYHWYLAQIPGDGEFRKCWDRRNLRLVPKTLNLTRTRKKFDWELVEELGLIDILPKGADQIWRERNSTCVSSSTA